jgi:DNA mismatch repair protein MutL
VGPVRILPEELANRIAAGEVIERPASVVKELVENALDAESTRIEIRIRGGGIRSIIVSDDGTGMSAADAALAFQRHATSKIRIADDLARIDTLGFRGEALASIGSVARVRMQTRRRGEAEGTEVIGEGEGVQEVRSVGCPEGTRIEVAELFSRVPARRKFLKSEVTESGHCVRWLERIALVRPDIHFSFERDGTSVLQLPATRDLRERVIASLPPSFGDRLLPVEGSETTARVIGFASPADVTRGSAADIHLYVNGRPVRDRLLLGAVRDAYRQALPPGRHPVIVLFLQLEPDQVDVNVHPAKWEVRFRDPGRVHRLVRGTLVQALGSPVALYPRSTGGSSAVGDRTLRPPPDLALGGPRPEGTEELHPGSFPDTTERSAGRPPLTFASLRYIGQALGTFLLFERPGGLVAIDQHAAHERVLYERLREAWFGGKVETQALLLPVWVELPRSAAEPLLARRDEFGRAGFEIEEGEGSVRGGVRVGLRTVPAVLAERPPKDGWAALIEETAVALRDPGVQETREGLEAGVHAALATGACHTACRKGDRLDPREVRALLEALDEAVWFPTCPHGRPIVALLDEQEISRRFLRS